MDEKHLEYFNKLLTEQLKNLLNQADGAARNLRDSADSMPDPTDRATFEVVLGFQLRIKDRESRLIKKILEALDRIEDGSYGICEECEEKISIRRLKARPVTILCIDCKTKQEAFEKAAGF
ncbi:RNA polymerase-binding protein DksA [Thermodesulfobacteriota bacterium]